MANERGFAMGVAVRLREDYAAAQLRGLARQSHDAGQTRRLLALAAIYDGGSRGAAAQIGGPDRRPRSAAQIGGVGLQTIRDWVLAFNARGPDGLIDGKAPGKVPLLDAQKRQALAKIVEEGPIPAAHGVVRWRLIDLAQWVFDQFAVSISQQTLSRELRVLGFRKLPARPRHHAQDGEAVAAFKKTSSPAWTRSPDARHRASQ
jgi:transposase